MSRVSSKPVKPQVKAPVVRLQAPQKRETNSSRPPASTDRFTRSQGGPSQLSLKRSDFLRAARPSSPPAQSQKKSDPRGLLFAEDNERFQSLAQAEKELKQLRAGNHPGMAQKVKLAEEKRDNALRSLRLGRRARKAQIFEQRTKLEAQREKDSEQAKIKLDKLKHKEWEIDRKFFQLQGDYVAKAKQEIADARAGLKAGLERRTGERASTFKFDELSGALQNSEALKDVPKDAKARLIDGQLEFENKSGHKVSVKASEDKVVARSDQRLEWSWGGKLPGDVVTSTLEKDGTLTDKTETIAKTYDQEKREYLKRERVQITNPDGALERTVKDFEMTYGRKKPQLKSVRETSLDESGTGREVHRRPNGEEIFTHHIQEGQAVSKTAPFPSESSLKAQAERVVSDSLVQLPERDGRSRHHTNALVQSQPVGGKEPLGARAHYDGSPVVVIAFEGTGSFDERRPKLMQEMGRCLQEQGVDTTDKRFSPAPLLDGALEKERGRGANWSGLSSGPLTEVVKDPELNQNLQWLSFPSEEMEVFAQDFSVSQLGQDIRRSSDGTSQGIDAAEKRIREIAEQAKRQGKSPKFVLLSHSSGGRSSVKFAEKMKGQINPATGKPFEFDLSVSFDPVREAHEAFGEVASKALLKTSILGLFTDAPKVSSQVQPESLFQNSNVDKWINFFQQSDTKGLKEPVEFGIHGSPIVGADNYEVRGLGEDAHGPVAYQAQVLEIFKREMHSLLDGKQERSRSEKPVNAVIEHKR